MHFISDRTDKIGVFNDPHGQTHSLASSEHYFQLKFALIWKEGTDGQWSLPTVTVGRPSGSK